MPRDDYVGRLRSGDWTWVCRLDFEGLFIDFIKWGFVVCLVLFFFFVLLFLPGSVSIFLVVFATIVKIFVFPPRLAVHPILIKFFIFFNTYFSYLGSFLVDVYTLIEA